MANAKPQRLPSTFRPRLRLPGPLGLAALAVALLLMLPVGAVAPHVFEPSEWMAHIATTLLRAYIANTLWLMIGVPLCTAVIGAGSAWLVTMCRFPGR